MTTLAWIIVLICVAITCYGLGCGAGEEHEQNKPKEPYLIQMGQSPYNPFEMHNKAPIRQIIDLDSGHGVYQSDYNALQDETNQLREQVRNLTARLDMTQDRMDEANKRNRELEAENTKLRDHNKSLSDTFDKSAETERAQMVEIAKLRGELTAYDKAVPRWTTPGGNYNPDFLKKVARVENLASDLVKGDVVIWGNSEGEIRRSVILEIGGMSIKTDSGSFNLCNRGKTWETINKINESLNNGGTAPEPHTKPNI